uniref:Uncharacterized protein n=1 Tax=Romanomermis culicivorax TaxID=13658 RepID=A0A915I4L7_ROMCU
MATKFELVNKLIIQWKTIFEFTKVFDMAVLNISYCFETPTMHFDICRQGFTELQ